MRHRLRFGRHAANDHFYDAFRPPHTLVVFITLLSDARGGGGGTINKQQTYHELLYAYKPNE